ncbi:MAG TPA: NEW3 domain-containing protein [Methylomirabilota bacterium]|nr:NEW3 domain-containing protein [Methylomirabilota bacterium]
MALRTRILADRRARFSLLRSATAAVLLALLLATGAVPAWAQPASSPETLTQSLVSLGTQYRTARPAHQPQALQNLLNVAAARRQQLLRLMESDPAAVLRVAVPAPVRASLPPQAQGYVEQEVKLDGELEVLHEDWANTSRYRYFLKTPAGERLSLHFAKEAPQLQTGARVRVRGVRLDGAVAAESGSTSVQSLAAAAPNTFGAQKTLVMLVNFQDNTSQPYTPSYAQGVVFTTTSSFFGENSSGQTWLTGNVAGWFTLPMSSAGCNYSQIATLAQQAAAAAGYNLANYNRYVYGFPSIGCGWWGLGTVGGNPSQAWVTGTFSLKVVGHEMGHNLGLWHSHALECGSTVLGSSCSSIEYGDTLDIMGNPSSGHFNAYQKERLGWLNYGASPPVTTVQSAGTYTIDTFETAGANPKALKILKSADPQTGQKTWYYVEFRQAVGYDSFLSGNTNVLNGVVIHLGTDASGNTNYLLDMTPATASWSDPALDVSLSFNDPNAGVTVTPLSVNGGSATVSVTTAPQPCVRGMPTVALTPSQSQWVRAGTPVSYTVSVTNTDSSGCNGSSFSMQASVPAGWGAALGSSALTLSPGAMGSTGLQVTSPTSASDGFYPVAEVSTNMADPNYKGSGQATYVVASAMVVTVVTDKPTYAQNQSATMTATVNAGGAPAAGVAVTFTIARPDGTSVTGTATTDASGKATYKFRVKRRDPTGTYQVSVKATLGNVSGTAATSFTVQ